MRSPPHPNLSPGLLATLALDVPPADAKRRALVALGVAEAVAAGGAAATAATSATKAALGSSAGTVKGIVGIGVSVWAKPLLVGALAGAVSVGAATAPALLRHERPLPWPSPSLSVPAKAPPRTMAAPRGVPLPPAPLPDTSLHEARLAAPPVSASSPAARTSSFEVPGIEEAPPPATAPPTRSVPPRRTLDALTDGPSARVAAASVPAESPALGVLEEERPAADSSPDEQSHQGPRSTLGAELRTLEAVRRLLSAGQQSTAHRALDDYERAFANGLLRPEAVVLRIEILVRQGDLPSAHRLASEFERAHPQSSHLRKVHALLGNDALNTPSASPR